MSKNRVLIADLSLIFIVIIWGATFYIVQVSVSEVPVFVFLFWRFAIATIVFALIMSIFRIKFDLKAMFPGILLGVFLILGFIFQTVALKYTMSSVVGFITGLNVAVIPILLFIVKKELPTKYTAFALCLAIFGLWLISGGIDSIGKGEILTSFCAIAFGFHIFYTGIYASKHQVPSLVLIQLFVSSLLCLVLAGFNNEEIILKNPSNSVISTILITSLLATVLAFFVQAKAQQITSSTKTAIIFLGEPVVAGLVGYFYVGEEITGQQALGALFIILAMVFGEFENIFEKNDKNSKS